MYNRYLVAQFISKKGSTKYTYYKQIYFSIALLYICTMYGQEYHTCSFSHFFQLCAYIFCIYCLCQYCNFVRILNSIRKSSTIKCTVRIYYRDYKFQMHRYNRNFRYENIKKNILYNYIFIFFNICCVYEKYIYIQIKDIRLKYV